MSAQVLSMVHEFEQASRALALLVLADMQSIAYKSAMARRNTAYERLTSHIEKLEQEVTH